MDLSGTLVRALGKLLKCYPVACVVVQQLMVLPATPAFQTGAGLSSGPGYFDHLLSTSPSFSVTLNFK